MFLYVRPRRSSFHCKLFMLIHFHFNSIVLLAKRQDLYILLNKEWLTLQIVLFDYLKISFQFQASVLYYRPDSLRLADRARSCQLCLFSTTLSNELVFYCYFMPNGAVTFQVCTLKGALVYNALLLLRNVVLRSRKMAPHGKLKDCAPWSNFENR